MKKNSEILLLSICLDCTTTKFDCVDKKACIEVEQHLEIISDFIFYSKENVESVVTSAKFMEKISGHASEADVQFDGQDPPTMNDYYTWTAWYTENYSNLSK